PSHTDRADAHRAPPDSASPQDDSAARQRWTLSTAALSVIGSIVDHRAKLPAIQVRALLAELAEAVLTAELPDVPDSVEDIGLPDAAIADPSKYEALLHESMRLFKLKGYRDTSMEDI